MIKKSLVIIAFFSCLLCFNVVKSLESNDDLVGILIYIDPGHGGADPGALYKDMKESDYNLSFSLKLKKVFEENGAIVYLTRDGDYDLSSTKIDRKRSDLYNRFKIINNSNANMYLSIHLNSDTSSLWYGPQVFYNKRNNNNVKLAEFIQNEFKKNLNSLREIGIINNLYMFDNIKITGVLIELGFISNYQDRSKLLTEEYQNDLIDSILYGIKKFIYD